MQSTDLQLIKDVSICGSDMSNMCNSSYFLCLAMLNYILQYPLCVCVCALMHVNIVLKVQINKSLKTWLHLTSV